MRGHDFYEDDERIEEIEARFEAGEKHATQPPSCGTTMHFDLGMAWLPVVTSATNHASREPAGI